jgi:hypothetical protein
MNGTRDMVDPVAESTTLYGRLVKNFIPGRECDLSKCEDPLDVTDTLIAFPNPNQTFRDNLTRMLATLRAHAEKSGKNYEELRLQVRDQVKHRLTAACAERAKRT